MIYENMRILRVAVRHIVSVGRRSLAVVIPKKWISILGVRAGEEVVLVMNEDGSITLYPSRTGDRDASKKNIMMRSVDSKAIQSIGREISSMNLLKTDRFHLKEFLTKYMLGYLRSLRGNTSEFSSSSRKILEKDHYIDLMKRSLDMVERSLEYLERFLLQSDEYHAKLIHEIEDKMDTFYYTFFKTFVEELPREIRRDLDNKGLVRYVANIVLIKILEDIVDSIDRITWRHQENGVATSNDSVKLFTKMIEVARESIGCIRYTCDNNEIGRNFNEVVDLKRHIKNQMITSPPSIQPVLAEAEILLNGIEGLLEIAIIYSIQDSKNHQN
ncbi:MAG: AbrB/MazE/SpoVT family DNA-binding domain-containing protein [Sulfolobales archaeon]